MDYFTKGERFTINSANRISGTDSNFVYEIHLNKNINYTDIVLLDASIPRTYYNVYENSYFVLEEDGQQVNINIPASSYNKTSFKIVIQQLLNDNSPHSYTYIISYQNINVTGDDGKYTITVSDNGGIQPKLIFNDSFYQQIGFEKFTTYEFENDILKSPNVMYVSKESTLFIRSDIVQNNNDNILININTADSPSFSNIVHETKNPAVYSSKFSNYNSNVYKFWITDENNNIINLNGSNVVFTIFVYKRSNIDKYIKAFIKFKSSSKLEVLDNDE